MACTERSSSRLTVWPIRGESRALRWPPSRCRTWADCSTRSFGMCGSTSLHPRKTGVPGSRAGVITWCAVGTNKVATQADQATVAACMARGVFECEPRSLGETQKDGAFGWNADFGQLVEDRGLARCINNQGSMAACFGRAPNSFNARFISNY